VQKELEADIVSIVYQCTPTPVPLTSAWRWRLVLNDLAGELNEPGQSDDSSDEIIGPWLERHSRGIRVVKEEMVR